MKDIRERFTTEEELDTDTDFRYLHTSYLKFIHLKFVKIQGSPRSSSGINRAETNDCHLKKNIVPKYLGQVCSSAPFHI